MTKAEETLHEALLFDGLEESQVPFEELKKAMCQHSIEFATWIYHNVSEEEWQRTTNEILYDQFNNQEP